MREDIENEGVRRGKRPAIVRTRGERFLDNEDAREIGQKVGDVYEGDLDDFQSDDVFEGDLSDLLSDKKAERGTLREELEKRKAMYRRGSGRRRRSVEALGLHRKPILKDEDEAVPVIEPEGGVDLERISRGLEREADKMAENERWKQKLFRVEKEKKVEKKTEEDKNWDALKSTLAEIEKFKDAQVRKVAEKLKKHERAQKVIRKTVRRGLALAGLTLSILAAGGRAHAESDMFAGRTEPEKVKIESDSGVKVDDTGTDDGGAMLVDLERPAAGQLVNMVPVTEDEAMPVDLETPAEGKLVDMVPVTEDEEWKSALATVENVGISDYDVQPGETMSWDEFSKYWDERSQEFFGDDVQTTGAHVDLANGIYETN